MAKLGLIVNPIAGMGGAVGLKGTDTQEILHEAIERGAQPVSPNRANEFFTALSGERGIELMVADGPMGKDIVDRLAFQYVSINGIPTTNTSRDDTIRIARKMVDQGIDILVFVGGDGTANDVLEAVGDRVTVLGVPAGVKIFSGVF
ncbi:MAG TPA: NAD(+)/NADH kinase, partial [Candidatus Binatus sp.]|nr:NAD(+)/NADH kinase [Candidatus Binatus sp.]